MFDIAGGGEFCVYTISGRFAVWHVERCVWDGAFRWGSIVVAGSKWRYIGSVDMTQPKCKTLTTLPKRATA